MEKKQKSIIVMNFSHVYEDEGIFQNKSYQWIDCTKIAGTDCFLDKEAEEQMKKIIKGYPVDGIHFIDSGNYHYVTKLWTDKLREPFSLILFDHHTDMQSGMFYDTISCGSWVKTMLDENPYLRKVILLGVKEELIGQIEEQYQPRIICYGEQQMQDKSVWSRFLKLQLKERVYISLDKDVLSRKETVTNWDQGSMSLQQLEAFLKYIIESEEVIGIDICGEAATNEPLFQRMQDDAINNKVNKELLTVIKEAEQEEYEEVINY